MSQHPVSTVSREKDLLVLQLLASKRYYVEDDGSIICAQWRNKGPVKLKQRRCKAGQWLVNLSTGGSPRQITALVSRVVALAKLGDPGMPLGAVHKDGNKDNNHPGNLVWMDLFEGMQNASANDSLCIYQGSDHANSKLSNSNAKNICKLWDNGKNLSEIALMFGVSRSTISRVVRGAAWVRVTGAERKEKLNTTLNNKAIRAIRRRIQNGESGASIARKFSVSPAAISKIKLGLTWRHVK